MRKIIVLTAIFLLAASMGAAEKGGTISNSILAGVSDKDTGEEYFVHATGLIDEIRDDDEVEFERREGRKGLNAVNVKVAVADLDGDGWGDAVSTRAKKGDRVALVGFVRGGGDCDDTHDVVHPRCVALTINEEGVEEERSDVVIGKVDVDNNPRRSDDGRNPQTGKEIKIPANTGGNSDGDVPREEVVLTAVVVHLNSIQDKVSFELKEGRKGMNAVNVKVLADGANGNGNEVSEAAHELTHVVQQGEARNGRNPQTGKEIKIPAKASATGAITVGEQVSITLPNGRRIIREVGAKK